ncbi:hypothetical protein QVD17_01440 [Tagetes erecta]|uniref:Uncharacterized protein n=1 Tax=Tagetes erecta TaxID=13708 RepID=A0AAD8L4X7_TARER|nr:hypothetical protein QVD17_01440 [Tagetes erecta]
MRHRHTHFNRSLPFISFVVLHFTKSYCTHNQNPNAYQLLKDLYTLWAFIFIFIPISSISHYCYYININNPQFHTQYPRSYSHIHIISI